jgi:class 3 adenylate cyclase/tetratricopeptide (TPR) repeat protein
MNCAACGGENRAGRKFCVECGSALGLKCVACGTPHAAGEKFCGECGAALVDPAPANPRVASAAKPDALGIRVKAEQADASTPLDGERKTVTALFADIKGSMELMEDLDPEEARAIVDPAIKLMIEAVHRYEGYIVQSTGDGIFALFGAPVAHEDHPLRALYAALRMQDELRRYSRKLREAGNSPIETRIGVNTGEVVIRSIATGRTHAEYTPIGHTTNLASRMQALAPTGSIAVSEQTRKLVEGYFALKPLGPTKIKGVSEPVNVFEVTGLGPLRTRLQRAAGRGLTKFVGRQREMEALSHAAELAQQGHGQIVAAVAEPGVGKSRLLSEFKVKHQTGWMVLESVSVSHGKASAFLPVIDLLWNYFKITSDDDERTRREKINGKVLTLERALEDALPYLYALLGLGEPNSPVAEVDPQTRKRRSLDAIKRILLRESLNQPLMVIFEDLHWVDEETQALLNLLADSIGTARILMLVNYRPEYSHPWHSKTYYTQLRLDPLGRESADEMLSALLGAGKDLLPLKRLIVDKTEGNPLFMEEIVLALQEDGALVRNGAVKLTRPIDALKVPVTVQGVIAARIDRLPANEKELLQTLAVIGMEFPLALARTVIHQSPEQLNGMLNDLQLAEFIYEQPAVGDIEYTFKHALTRDVAYNSVLVERRKALHERIGAAVESLYSNSLEDHLAELAHHYVRSGNAGKAVEFCLRACRQCVGHASYKEAVAHFEAGLEKLEQLPDDERHAEIELELRIAVQDALLTVRGYASPESEQATRRAIELSRRPGIEWGKGWYALSGLRLVELFRGEMRGARETVAQLVASAQEHGSGRHLACALYLRAIAMVLMGEFEPVERDLDRAMANFDSMTKSSLEATELIPTWAEFAKESMLALSGENLWFLGYPDRALQRVQNATAAALESGSRAVLAVVHEVTTFTYLLAGDNERLRERAEALLELATELGDPFRIANSHIYLGWTVVMGNDLDAGITGMQHNLAKTREHGTGMLVPYFLALIASALGKSGKPADGLREIDESLALIQRTGECMCEAEVWRLKGELLLLAQPLSNDWLAEQSFRTAIEISRKQHAKSWELRAATSFASLLSKKGRIAEARNVLAPVYNWFTEGFDAADLKNAKALLDELRS